ncbi:hypothetical protein EGT68_010115 [Acinetobacter junii]|uniref:virulence factor TspB C-terminal domain-related protein n=1 Tax=Acinetobacter junii TaxID=40215 RepID=UPI000F687401|nr:virulence factor TspB C-terminal domain-related protein [Acinetobacter junii]QXR09861.1 hypothetical protein EGT68_010115 [Acinetobacter junii]
MKSIIKLFICLSLIYTPFFAFAGAAEKWEVLENNYDHVSNKVKIEARKITQSAANSGVYKVQVPVNASTLGSTVKMMLKGGVASAALYGLVEGVGWIIDEGSKTIKKPSETQPSTAYQYIWGGYITSEYETFSSPEEYKSKYEKTFPSYVYVSQKYEIITTDVHRVTFSYKPDKDSSYLITPGVVRTTNPNYIPGTTIYTEVSDSELGNEITGNGQNTSPVPEIITDAYSPNNPVEHAPAPQQTQDALDNANPEPEKEPSGETKPKPNTDTDGDGEPDTHDPTQPDQGTEFQLPNFCSWAPAVCDFFTVQKADNKEIKKNQREQIEQDKTFFEKVTEWFDWSQADDDLPDNESPDIVEHVTPDLKEDAISWGASCPADVSIPISMQGVTSTLVFSWSPWCQLLSIIKPAIVASAYIGAAFIVLGLRT